VPAIAKFISAAGVRRFQGVAHRGAGQGASLSGVVMAAALLVAVFLSGAPAVAAAAARGPVAAGKAADPDGRLARLRAVAAVQRRHVDELMALRDVVGTGTGLDPDGAAVIRVLTARPGVPDLPASLDGVPVRVRVSGRIYALRGATCESSGDAVCENLERWPLPVPIGVSVGHPDISAGTIGARVTDSVDVFVLSNNHVLANSNQAAIGDAALQPGPSDGGSLAAGDAIGTVHDFEPIRFCELGFPLFFCGQPNLFDAAIALSSQAELGFATPGGEFGSTIGYGAPNRVIHPAYGDPAVLGDEDLSQLQQLAVQKFGRTTGLTTGNIDTTQLTVNVCYDELCSLAAQFEDQLAISGPFSDGGDSGSLVVTDDADRHPVALLFAGSDTETIVSRIDLVLGRFGVGIDDGGATAPIADAALQDLEAPSFAIVDQTAIVAVTVRNLGTEPLPPFDVVLGDAIEAISSALATPTLDPGAQVQLDFDWTPTLAGTHILTATLQLGDDDPTNDHASLEVPVLLDPPGL